MPARNADIIRRGYERLNEEGVDAILEMIDPEFEATSPPDLAVEPQTYRGPAGVKLWFDSFYDAVDEVRLEGEDFIEAGDSVVVPARLWIRGRDSGIEVEQRFTQVWRMRDGRAIGMEAFADHAEALAAAGLSRQADASDNVAAGRSPSGPPSQ